MYRCQGHLSIGGTISWHDSEYLVKAGQGRARHRKPAARYLCVALLQEPVAPKEDRTIEMSLGMNDSAQWHLWMHCSEDMHANRGFVNERCCFDAIRQMDYCLKLPKPWLLSVLNPECCLTDISKQSLLVAAVPGTVHSITSLSHGST